MKVEIGQKLYRQYGSGISKLMEIKELTVTKTGRKYFYCDDNNNTPFSYDDLRYTNKDYSQSNVQLYLSEQSILDKVELERLTRLCKKAFDLFSRNTFSLDQIRQVVDILKLEEEVNA